MKQLFTFLFLLPFIAYSQLLSSQKFKFALPINRPTISEAPFYESPNSYNSSLFLLPKNTPLQLIGLYDGYYRVRYKDTFGFVHFVSVDGDYEKFASNSYTADGPRDFYDYENEPNDIVLYAKIEFAAPLLMVASIKSDTICIIPNESAFKITHYTKKYWKAEYKEKVGYIAKNLVLRTAKTLQDADHPKGDYYPKTTKESMAQADAGIKEASRVLKEANGASSRTSYKATPSSYYIRGPRGGCYYITASGRKQYVDRSLCN